MRMPSTSRERFGSRRGNAMVEFALSATLLTSVFTGVFQFGYSMYMYNELVEAVRAGTRYASVANISNSGDRSTPTAFSTAVKNMVVYGTPSPGNSPTPVVPNLGTGQVAVSVDFGTNPKHCPTQRHREYQLLHDRRHRQNLYDHREAGSDHAILRAVLREWHDLLREKICSAHLKIGGNADHRYWSPHWSC